MCRAGDNGRRIGATALLAQLVTTPWAMSRQKGMPSNEGRRWRRKAPSTRSARPRRCLPPHPYISAALRRTRRRRRTMRAVTWSQQAPPSPLRGGGGRPTSRCGAAPVRAAEPSPVHLRAPYAHAVRTVPNPVLRAGGRVVATAPAPSSARGSSAIVIAGCTILGKLPLRLHISKSARVPSADRVVLSYR